ncbi:uncharacterized protein LOC141607698 [Silene latifolia]|uniref:uncharacterized protein LOC141607698 n=1 Tax=Silene latifolia TaxID=37657 RepID=UPI003D76FB1F
MVKSGQKNKGARPLPKKTGPSEEEVIRTKPISIWFTKRGKKTVVQDEEDDKLENLIQLTKEDIKDEIEYWNNAVYWFVLGANPPWEVLNGFIMRIWQKHNVDKISFMPNGIFLVRFKESKDRDAILQAGHFMFDNKPLIVRVWTEETELTKEDVKNVPTWVRIKALPLKFWGKCLPTIAGLLGKFQRADQATVDKTRLGFARVMIEDAVGQKFPSKVKFLDENGKVVALDVEFEWKSTVCSKCKGIGHEHTTCRSGTQTGIKKQAPVQKVWKPVVAKPVVQLTNTQVSVSTEERTPSSSPVKQVTSTESSPDRSYREVASGSGIPKNNVKWFIHNKDIGLFGLIETKVNGANVSNISSSMLDGWCVTTNSSCHKGGRVWILWRPSLFDVHILQYDAQFIHTRVIARIFQQQFYLTMVYAFNDGIDRRELWSHLERIAGHSQGPWAIAGDFNTVITPEERLGENTKQSDMDEFIDCLATCGMTDIPATGAFYTWTNKQDSASRIYSRLDRFLINQDWQSSFPDMMAHFHPAGLFDHSP